MKIDDLEEVLKIAGRYQVYSDGAGNFGAMPVPDRAVLLTPEAEHQINAQPDKLIYNNQQG